VRLVFFGSPVAAVTVLDRLLEAGHEVPLVVSQPDKPVGRKGLLTPCPAAARARERGIPLLQPTKLRLPEVREAIAAAGARAGIVVAYGRIIPAEILSLPPLGLLNVHFSLLPRHRGASPVAAAILAGDRESGVTIMRLDEGLDTGPLLDRLTVPLDGTERTGALTGRLAALGADLLVALLRRFEGDEPVPAVVQDGSLATLCRPVGKEEGRIRWEEPALLLDRRLRAFDPWPGVFTTLREERVRILDAAPRPEASEAPPGTILRIEKSEVVVAAGENCWALLRLGPEGKGEMDAAAFARGRRLVPGDRFR
jgi:methionyl-tRNA formyltransferase